MQLRAHSFALPLLLLLHSACWLVFKPPAPASDDFCYVQSAHALLEGNYHWNESPKNNRIGIIAPAAFFISVFGENDFSVSAWSLLCSLLTITVLYFFLLKFSGPRIAFIACFLLAVNITQITYSAALFPDVIVSFFALAVVVCIFYGRARAMDGRFYAVLCPVFFFAGFLCKEIIVLILPFVLAVFAYDIRAGRNISFWRISVLIFILFGVALFMTCYFITGDVLFFYHNVEKSHNDVFVALSGEELPARLTFLPAVWLFERMGYFPLLLFAIPALISHKRKGLQFFMVVYFISVFIALWAGSSSLTRWAPMLLLDRMWMLMLVPLCVLVAFTIEAWAQSLNRKYVIALILFFPAGFIALYVDSVNRALLFVLFGTACLMPLIPGIGRRINVRMRMAIILLPFLLLSAVFLYRNSNWLQ